MLDALGTPFPREAIKARTGGGGKQYSYVETHSVIHRLNSATDGVWDFRIVNVEWRADLLIVQGELTIPGLGTRSGFGVQKVAANAGEDLVKGGSSDCLKKCATLFGVGLELYGPDYEAGETQQMNRVQAMPQRGPQRDSGPPPAEPYPYDGGMPQDRPGPSSDLVLTDRQRNLILALAREQKVSNKALDDRCRERFGAPLAEISRADASVIIETMKEAQAAQPQAMA